MGNTIERDIASILKEQRDVPLKLIGVDGAMDLKAFLQETKIPFEENIDLKKKTWIHRGGMARYYIIPDTLEQLCCLVTKLYTEKIDFKIVGHTSNIYIRNTTNFEVIISTIHLNHFQENDGQYVCECGVAIATLSKQAIDNGHAGYEGFVNLPGTVASAVFNNASCFKCSISDLLIEASVLCPDGIVRTYKKDQFHYSERSSAFKRGEEKGVILNVVLDCGQIEAKEVLYKRAEANTLYRKTRQEGPKQNLGSTYPIYVMASFYKHLPLHTRICLILSTIIYKMFGKQRPQSVVNSIILLCCGKYALLHRYVSKHNFGCFVWRDEKADEAFPIYRSLIAKTSGLLDIEIEVI